MAIGNKLIKVLFTEAEGLHAQFQQGGAESEAAAAVAVLISKVTRALVGIIDELAPRGMQGPTAHEEKKQLLQQA